MLGLFEELPALAISTTSGRDYTERTLESAYEIKFDIAGPKPQGPKEIKILWRIVTFTPEGIQDEPDPGHMEKAIHKLVLTEGKGVATPGVRDETDVSAAELLERRRCFAPPQADPLPAPGSFAQLLRP